MANNKNPQRNPRSSQRPARRSAQRRRPSRPAFSLSQWIQKRRERDLMEFKPDAQSATIGKTLKLTRLQQLRLARWSLYALTVILALVIQDVIMSQVSIFGATTDLAACAILLITVMEGTEIGSIFVLISSILYYFSGSAPGPYCIALLTFLGIGATLFRQMYWHRSRGSITLCAAIAVTGYELGLFAVGLYYGLTHLGRISVFLFTAVFSCIVLIPLYSLIHKIGMIGGNIWKE
ncbi:MAG: hypothetical protein IJD98_03975 [Oscillospiraceae bacterium]|nr:hypothetical protein [Oscillospiraceae bacterium]